jgi:hypothetical protein
MQDNCMSHRPIWPPSDDNKAAHRLKWFLVKLSKPIPNDHKQSKDILGFVGKEQKVSFISLACLYITFTENPNLKYLKKRRA